MNKTAEALYEAHVAFILNSLETDKLPALIGEEAAFIWDRLNTVQLGEVIDKAEILDFQRRNFEHRERMSEPAKQYAHSLRDAIIDHLRQSETTLNDIVNKKDYDRLVSEVAGLKEIRERLIHSVISNPLYGEIIANILADGIKSFTSEEGLAGKIPGASSFFKMGSGLLGGLQDSIDKNVRKFIAENIQKLTGSSEQFVQNLIDDRKVKEMGEQLWQKASVQPVKKAMRDLDAKQFEGFEPIVEDIVNNALRSEPARALNEVIIDHFMAENGEKSLQRILLDIEISEDDVTRESVDFFSKVVQRSLSDGTLEERLRKHLANFYESPAVADILK